MDSYIVLDAVFASVMEPFVLRTYCKRATVFFTKKQKLLAIQVTLRTPKSMFGNKYLIFFLHHTY